MCKVKANPAKRSCFACYENEPREGAVEGRNATSVGHFFLRKLPDLPLIIETSCGTASASQAEMSIADQIEIFSPRSSQDFAEMVCAHLGVTLAPIEQKRFPENGEYKYRPLKEVTNKNVFIIHSVYGDEFQTVHDKLCELLFLTATLKADLPKRVTVVAPYLCYMRKDRQIETHDPVTTKYLACLMESVGTDSIITMDVHNLSAFQNASRCHSIHLEAIELFVEYFAEKIKEPITVVSPDLGGVKRAEKFRQALHDKLGQEVEIAYMTKVRRDSIQSVSRLTGNVKKRTAIVIDDMISSGSTMGNAIDASESAGASEVHLAASHGLFTREASQYLSKPALKSIVVTNSVRPYRLEPKFITEKLVMMDISRLVANAIRDSTGTFIDTNEVRQRLDKEKDPQAIFRH